MFITEIFLALKANAGDILMLEPVAASVARIRIFGYSTNEAEQFYSLLRNAWTSSPKSLHPEKGVLLAKFAAEGDCCPDNKKDLSSTCPFGKNMLVTKSGSWDIERKENILSSGEQHIKLLGNSNQDDNEFKIFSVKTSNKGKENTITSGNFAPANRIRNKHGKNSNQFNSKCETKTNNLEPLFLHQRRASTSSINHRQQKSFTITNRGLSITFKDENSKIPDNCQSEPDKVATSEFTGDSCPAEDSTDKTKYNSARRNGMPSKRPRKKLTYFEVFQSRRKSRKPCPSPVGSPDLAEYSRAVSVADRIFLTKAVHSPLGQFDAYLPRTIRR